MYCRRVLSHSTTTTRALLASFAFLVLACDEAEPPGPEAREENTAGPPAESPTTPPTTPVAPSATLARGQGHIHFTVQGGVFPEPVVFDLTSDAFRSMSPDSSLNVVQMRLREQDWISEDGQALLTTLIFSIDVPPEPGVYERPQYDFNFGLAADVTAPRTKSVRPEGETGTVTVTERTEDHVIGTFDVRGHATQMHSTEPVYSIRGNFAFARRR